MSYLIVRPALDTDRAARDNLIRSELAALRMPAFWMFLFQEVTLQAVVLCGAALFIFCGASLMSCALVLPAAALVVYLLVFMGHASLAEKHIQDSRKELLGVVCELRAPLGALEGARAGAGPGVGDVRVLDALASHYALPEDAKHMHAQLVATASVSELWGPAADGGWLHAVAMRDPGVYAWCGGALVRGAGRAGRRAGLRALLAALGDLQGPLRDALHHDGWQWRGQYHRRLLGGALSLAISHHAKDLASDTH